MERDDSGMEGMLAYRFAVRKDRQALFDLITLWDRGGDREAALDLGMLLDPGDGPVESLLAAAMERRRWSTFDRLCAALPEEDRGFWAGRRAERLGHFDVALRQYARSTHPEAMQAAEPLRAGLSIRRRLGDADPRRRLAALDTWATWWSQAPQTFTSFTDAGKRLTSSSQHLHTSPSSSHRFRHPTQTWRSAGV